MFRRSGASNDSISSNTPSTAAEGVGEVEPVAKSGQFAFNNSSHYLADGPPTVAALDRLNETWIWPPAVAAGFVYVRSLSAIETIIRFCSRA